MRTADVRCYLPVPGQENGNRRYKKHPGRKDECSSGPSGVGKSSMVNLLAPDAQMETGEISRKIDRGKHTTRHSEILPIGTDTFICDTPGFSSLAVWDMEKEELKECFHEFAKYEGQCRFLGCTHTHEPGCAVKEALEAGDTALSGIGIIQRCIQN